MKIKQVRNVAVLSGHKRAKESISNAGRCLEVQNPLHLRPRNNILNVLVCKTGAKGQINVERKFLGSRSLTVGMEGEGWTTPSNTYSQLPAPDYLTEVIRCNCKTECNTLRCNCRKHGIDCLSICGD